MINTVKQDMGAEFAAAMNKGGAAVCHFFAGLCGLTQWACLKLALYSGAARVYLRREAVDAVAK